VKTRHYVAAALGTACIASPALAQDQGLEEIVVTAQKREQNVQDVPIAITAFSAETLKDKAIGDIGALTRFAPNVNLDTGSPFSGDTSVLSASIRGIGQDDFAFNLDPGVGVYVDGVYLARTIGANQSLLDIGASVRRALLRELAGVDARSRATPEVIENVDVDRLEAHIPVNRAIEVPFTHA